MPQSLSITCLALMTDSQNADGVKRRIEPIERKISSYSPRDNELANMRVNSPPDERMGLKNSNCASNILECLGGLLRRAIEQELDNSLEVCERLIRVDYSRHCTSFGRAVLRPAIRALR